MKYIAFLVLLSLCYFLCEQYRRFREKRREQLDALWRYLVCIEEEMRLYGTARGPKELSAFASITVLGLEGKRPFCEELSHVLMHMALLESEKQKIKDFCKSFGDGNLKTEQEKLNIVTENVKSILQKEESEGKKSVQTVRIVAFTITLCLVILFL